MRASAPSSSSWLREGKKERKKNQKRRTENPQEVSLFFLSLLFISPE
jgi:hypothetical protein